MCGRYFLHRDPAALARHFGAANPTPNFAPSWNIAPTQDSLVLRRHPETGARHLDLLRWGLVPRWAKDASAAARLMNARDDSVAVKPSFREAFRKRRCLVPMDGFYEWRAEGGRNQPYACALRSGAPMACAGLWEGWRQPDGAWLRSYTIITTAAAGRQALLHARMPVILPPEAWDPWLTGEDEAALLALLRPAEDALLAFWPVSARVGRVAENDPGLLARDPAAQPPPELDDPPPRANDP
ncbi:SOS response-associated peptidase [Rubritepida flocculans]|jgi:putative SOS response-associated peptidase YedK|uniref:SOS response-associated peptidase n=1 Tax=Rubritepida flocculans TaxID=182403 RepID=UPI0004125C3D|nr:SOS response-associated peptidase [Rubritepida flocculans]